MRLSANTMSVRKLGALATVRGSCPGWVWNISSPQFSEYIKSEYGKGTNTGVYCGDKSIRSSESKADWLVCESTYFAAKGSAIASTSPIFQGASLKLVRNAMTMRESG
jgi:hypothetical protein